MKPKHKSILKSIGLQASKYDIKVWLVGGCPRDEFVGKKTEDIDICFEGEATPLFDLCTKEYGAEIIRFKDFGTARAIMPSGFKIDFVRCRKEVYDKPAALPKVSPSNLKDDLLRRDFTCNALALSLLPSEFLKPYDLFNSIEAIQKGYIKILHDKSFIDDPTRIFRAVRFSARFCWPLEKRTEKLLKQAIKEDRISLLSRVRIVNEFIKMLEEPSPYFALKLAQKYGLNDYLFVGLKFNKKIDLLKTLKERIAFLTLLQGKKAKAFLGSLPINKKELDLSAEVLNWYLSKAVPSKTLPKDLLKIIKLYKPSIESYKLKPLPVKSGDLIALGYKGEQLGLALKLLSKTFYQGKISTKRAALSYMKKRAI